MASMQYSKCTSSPSGSPDSSSAPRLGLEHISARRRPSAAVLQFVPGGLISKRENPETGNGAGGGKRGQIFGFSKPSKRRLDRFLACVQWARCPAHFVTLTYHFDPAGGSMPPDGGVSQSMPSAVCDSLLTAVPPTFRDDLDECSDDVASPSWRLWKNDLRAFGARLEREYGDRVQAVIWKQEFQKRGVVHFHLTLFWREGKEELTKDLSMWVAKAWNEIAEPGDGAHFRHGTSVLVVYNVEGGKMRALMSYLSKYMAKSYELAEPTGRIWGHWGEVPTEILATVWIPWRDLCWLTRRLRRWGRESRYCSGLTANWPGFLVMGDGCQLWQFMDGMTGAVVTDD